MPKAICIKSKPHPKISFEKGEIYDYFITENDNGENSYIVQTYGDYISIFTTDGENKFSTYFRSLQEMRDEKIKDILAE
jgi:hypothetical protein